LVALHEGLKDCGIIYVRTHGVMNEDLAYLRSSSEAGAGCSPSTPTKNHCGNHLLTQVAVTPETFLATLERLKAKLVGVPDAFGTSPHAAKKDGTKDGTVQTY